MAAKVDTPAAEVHRKILGGQINSLTQSDRTAWATFIMAQWARGPVDLKKLCGTVNAAIDQEFAHGQSEWDILRDEYTEATLIEFAEKRVPDFRNRVALERALPTLVFHKDIGTILVNMKWGVFNSSGTDLLLGDRPALRQFGLKSRQCFIALPISRYSAFIAHHVESKLEFPGSAQFARFINKLTATCAVEKMFSYDETHRPLIDKWAKVRTGSL